MHKLLSISMPGTSLRSLCTFNSSLSFVYGARIYVPRGQRRTSSVYPCPWERISHVSGTRLTVSNSQWSSSLHPTALDYRHAIHAQLFMWVLVIHSQSSCLHGKHSHLLSHGLSPALASFNPVKWKLLPPSLCRREDGSRRLAQPAHGPISVEAVREVQARSWDPVCVSGTTKAIICIPSPVWDWT